MTRKTYVYRLDVTLPTGSSEPGWEPENYEEIYRERWDYAEGTIGYENVPDFQWPARRLSFSATSARKRKELLERYGAKVEIIRSLPVEWPEVAKTFTEQEG